MAIVRDVQPPERPRRPLDLRGASGHPAPPRLPPNERSPLVRDVAPVRGAAILATVWGWVARRVTTWSELRRLRAPRPRRVAHPHAALTVTLAPPNAGVAARVRPVLPFTVGLAAFTLVLLGGVVTVRLVSIERATRDRAVAALDASRLGLGALARSETALATAHFADARGSLAEAEELLQRLSVDTALRALSPAEHSAATVRAADDALAAGEDLAASLDALRRPDTRTALERAASGLGHLRAADAELAHVGALLPGDLRAQVDAARAQLRDVRGRLAPLETHLPALRTFAGADGPRRYLLLFQNTAERRGTGGFIGSFALVEFDALALTRFEFTDVYTVDWKQRNLVPAPSGLQRYYSTLHLRDANYSPDFPTAASWVERGYVDSGGAPLDGVLAVDSDVFFDLLDALGPIPLPGTDTPLTRERAFDLLTVRIETSKRAPEGPKAVLADLLPTIGERLQDRERWGAVAAVLERALAGGHLRVYSDDAPVEALAVALGVDGQLGDPPVEEDELLLVSTNVGGNKSDRFITQRLAHVASVAADGRVTDELTVEREHRLPESFDADVAPLLAGYDPKTRVYLRSVLGDAQNRDYLRVFLPRGTTVREVTGVSAEDWELREEHGRTVVGIHVTTNVGETTRIRLRYDLPFTLDLTTAATYRLRARRTPGASALALTHELRAAPGITIVGTSASAVQRDLSGTSDAASAAVLTRAGATLGS